jgi:hypothetical protein
MEAALCAEPVAGFFEEFKGNLAEFVADFFTLSLDKAEIVVTQLREQGVSNVLPGDNLMRLILLNLNTSNIEGEVVKAVRKPRKLEEIVDAIEVPVPHVDGGNVWSAPEEEEIVAQEEIAVEKPKKSRK